MTNKLDFAERLRSSRPEALRAGLPETLLLNVGRRCDLACSHCHHRCSPFTSEAMTVEVADAALDTATECGARQVDITGGSPELWPQLPEFVRVASERALPLRVRTNLVPLGRPEGRDLVSLFARTGVTVLASVPEPGSSSSGLRPGAGDEQTRALRALAEVGYGADDGPGLELAINPEQGLPKPEEDLLPAVLGSLAPLRMTRVRVRSIANAPLGRYGDHLAEEGTISAYLHRLADAFQVTAVDCLPCRSGIAVAWDGRLTTATST